MNVWRIHLKPGSVEGVYADKFCIDNGVVGIGYRLDTAPHSKDDYWKKAKDRYYGKYKRGWSAAANAVVYRMSIDDLIWTRDRKATYYLGRITSDWRHEMAKEYANADIVNLRDCDWVKIGSETGVPGKVISSFRSRSTVQRVRDQSAEKYSKFTFNQEKGKAVYGIDSGADTDILSLLSDEDLEDVVGIYLQIDKHCIVYPSTCKKESTHAYCTAI